MIGKPFSNEIMPEERQSAEFTTAKRSLIGRLFRQFLHRRKGQLVLLFIASVVIMFSLAVLQHRFVHAQLYRTTKQELSFWAMQVAQEIAYKDKWDLEGYRRSSITVPSWCVVTKDGLIVDIAGFIPGLFGKIEVPDETIYNAPQTVIAATTGETWRLFGRKVVGGSVIVGVFSGEDAANSDPKLIVNAAKFGSTLDDAARLNPREIALDVDYAIMSSNGELKTASGGIPLKTDIRALPVPSNNLAQLISSGKTTELYFQPILDSHGQEVATIIVPKDMSLEQAAVRAQDRFNYVVVAIAVLMAFASVVWFFVRDFMRQNKGVTIEDALRVGESRTIEFKSTFQWDVRQGIQNDDRRLDILKSIAGFLNDVGGTLFIGVTEDTKPPSVRGLGEDLKLMGGSKDRLQRLLRDQITSRIGPEFSPFIADTIVGMNDRDYWSIVVDESPEPAFVRWNNQKKFYVREGPKTSDLDNERTWHYIKNKWG